MVELKLMKPYVALVKVREIGRIIEKSSRYGIRTNESHRQVQATNDTRYDDYSWNLRRNNGNRSVSGYARTSRNENMNIILVVVE
jgi:hypothetical protein